GGNDADRQEATAAARPPRIPPPRLAKRSLSASLPHRRLPRRAAGMKNAPEHIQSIEIIKKYRDITACRGNAFESRKSDVDQPCGRSMISRSRADCARFTVLEVTSQTQA